MRDYIWRGIVGCCGLLSVLSTPLFAQQWGAEAWITRYEFAALLDRAQCGDCLTPSTLMERRYDAARLEKQKNNPQKALDDIVLPKSDRWGQDYYYCVASTIDKWVMNGYPKSTSPYCPGKFCGSSFLTWSEFAESLVRLIGPTVRDEYPIDWRAVAVRAKDSPAVTFTQRARVAEALRRCPQDACPAINGEEFDLWLRRCTREGSACGVTAYRWFAKDGAVTAKLNVLMRAWVIEENMLGAWSFSLVSRSIAEQIVPVLQGALQCTEGVMQDGDRDSIADREDSCPEQYDPLQADLDRDGRGDVCDTDVDGDGIGNGSWLVDAGWSVVPRVFLLSSDRCIGVGNTSTDCISTGSFRALQASATVYRGTAPLVVSFTQENKWLTGLLQWEFGDGVVKYGTWVTHLFEKWGIYLVKVTAPHSSEGLLSMVPIDVLPNGTLQAWVEIFSQDILAFDTPMRVQHIGVGDIKKVILRAGTVTATINPKEIGTLTWIAQSVTAIELQAYNSVGQRVALAQFSRDSVKKVASQVHASSLDPLAGKEVALSTIIWWFRENEVAGVVWDFGDGQRGTGGLLTAHTRSTPWVYVVKQTIQFRDPTQRAHENIVTIWVRSTHEWRKLHLVSDALEKWRWEEFVFTLETDNFPVTDLVQCQRSFTDRDVRTIPAPTVSQLRASFTYYAPGSYPVMVLCQDTSKQRYHAAVTVAVGQAMTCLGTTSWGRCDLDKDRLPDLCDDDIDGDGVPNLMNLLTKEYADCRIDTGNMNMSLLEATASACAAWANLDNCSFVVNRDQADANGDGWGDVCSPTAPDSAWWWGWWVWWGDSDWDGIADAVDACGTTPESANGKSDADGCPEAPKDSSTDPNTPPNPLVEVESCTQCPCPEADYKSSLWKGDRIRALLLDPWGTVIYKYTEPEIIQEDIPDKLLWK